MTQMANNYSLEIQRLTQEWLASLPLAAIEKTAQQSSTQFGDRLLDTCMNYVRRFLVNIAYDDDDIQWLQELYFYQAEERAQIALLTQNVETDTGRYYKDPASKEAQARLATLRHKPGHFPMIELYGTNTSDEETVVLEWITAIHRVINKALDQLEADTPTDVSELLQTACYGMAETCQHQMAACIEAMPEDERIISSEPLEWFKQFLMDYANALQRLVRESQKETRLPGKLR